MSTLEKLETSLNEKYFLVKRNTFWGGAIIAVGFVIASGVISYNRAVDYASTYLQEKAKEAGLQEIRIARDSSRLLVKSIADLERSAKEGLMVCTAMPIGTILAWHKNLSSNLQLEDGSIWVECNGQTLDKRSIPNLPFDKIVIPNLNGQARFLRGSKISGVFQGDQFKKHTHELLKDEEFYMMSSKTRGNRNYTDERRDHKYYEKIARTEPEGGEETRPTNMSVVWIMRIR